MPEGCDLGAALSHVESRIVTNDYTFPWYGKHYQIEREDLQPGMKRQSLRVELRLDGELTARYEGRYVKIRECGEKPVTQPKTNSAKPVRRDYNAGGRSRWMDGFWEKACPPLWQAIAGGK